MGWPTARAAQTATTVTKTPAGGGCRHAQTPHRRWRRHTSIPLGRRLGAPAVWQTRANAAAWPALLGTDTVRDRPAPDRWSALEYACHVRDVFALFAERLALMLQEDDPVFANWDPNVTAEAERYHEQNPAEVAAQLSEAGTRIADRFTQLSAQQLQRPGRRSDGASFSVETFARYEIHDPLHHLWDVTGESLGGWTA